MGAKKKRNTNRTYLDLKMNAGIADMKHVFRDPILLATIIVVLTVVWG